MKFKKLICSLLTFSYMNVCICLNTASISVVSSNPLEYSEFDEIDTYAIDDTYYANNKKSGDGLIIKSRIDDYVVDNYPKYSLVESYSISTDLYTPNLQMYTSFYVKQKCDSLGNPIKKSFWSEANCVLNSIYVIFKNWEAKGIIHTTPYYDDCNKNIESDFLYSIYGIKEVKYDLENKYYYYWRPHNSEYDFSHNSTWIEKMPTLLNPL